MRPTSPKRSTTYQRTEPYLSAVVLKYGVLRVHDHTDFVTRFLERYVGSHLVEGSTTPVTVVLSECRTAFETVSPCTFTCLLRGSSWPYTYRCKHGVKHSVAARCHLWYFHNDALPRLAQALRLLHRRADDTREMVRGIHDNRHAGTLHLRILGYSKKLYVLPFPHKSLNARPSRKILSLNSANRHAVLAQAPANSI